MRSQRVRTGARRAVWAGVFALVAGAFAGCVQSDRVESVAGCGTGEVAADERRLTAALEQAQPGDVVVLDARTYRGRFAVTARGTEREPIRLCAPAGAVIDAGDITSGYALHFEGARHWQVHDLVVRGGLKTLMLDDADHNRFVGVTVQGAGHEAVHLRRASSRNAFEGLTVDGAGLHEPTFGEGIYVGSASSNWCDLTNCEPDASDHNTFTDVTVSATTAEPIDIKEGTTGGQIHRARLDTTAMTHGDSYVDVKGSRWSLADIVGQGGARYGVALYAITGGWGSDNQIASSRFDVGPAGQGVFVADSARAGRNRVCDVEPDSQSGDGQQGC